MSHGKDRFFGLHFDFHASPKRCEGLRLGEYLKKEDIEDICRRFRPDFIQIDCKGHPGYTSYPTKVGTAAAEFAVDPLALWREVTARHGVALFMHYSGVWDTRYLEEHPEDAKESPVFKGVADWLKRPNYTSVFSPYVDRRMIPQLKEVADYGVDGVWVDGDCWACTLDVSDHALDAFEKETGIRLQKEDIVPESEHFERYHHFCREGFRRYIDHYARALHAHRPDFRVASNWAYSEQMPEKVTTDVDFLSGDFSPYDAFNGALFSARILASQGKPWDLMSWGFRRIEGEKPSTTCVKHPVQLMQEAAIILSLGGGYQAYFKQNPDASPCLSQLFGMEALADFCHARRDFCFGAKTLPSVVIFNSTYDHYNNIPAGMLFGNHWLYETHRGWCKMLSDGGHAFEIREEHNLLPNIDDYKMIVCPEIITGYEKQTVDALLGYAQRGGVLVLAGIKTLAAFGIAHEAPAPSKDLHPVLTVDGGHADDLYGDFVEIAAEGKTLAVLHKAHDIRYFDTTYALAKAIPHGRGRIIAIGCDMGFWYQNLKTVSCLAFSEKLFDHYTPCARVLNTHHISLNVTQKDGRMQIHLVNSLGAHADRSVDSYQDVPPLYHLSLEVYTEKKPLALTYQPSGEALPFTYENGVLRAELPRVDIYEIAEISFA